jgi:peptide/nickel transport system substrate-binding protein
MKARFFTWIALVAILALSLPLASQAQSTLVIGRGADANSLDPAEGQSFEAIKMSDWMFDGLVRFEGNSHDIGPALATSWDTSKDGKVWTFHLRKGVKFHDGTPFNADAVVFSLERQRDKSSPYYSKFFARYPAKFSAIEVTRKVDDYTVQLVLKNPDPALLVNLAFYVGYIVSPTAVKNDKEGFRTHPVGTGYYKFVRWVKDDLIEMEANKDYWDGAPKIGRVIVKVIPDNDVRLLALQKGEIQLAYGIDYTHFSDVEKDPNLDLSVTSTLGISLISMNMDMKPFDNPKVREAMNYAVNRQRIFQTVFYGKGEIANQILPPNWFGHNPSIKGFPYDPEKAKKLLAEAGFPNGFKTDLISWVNPRPYNPSPRDTVALVKSDLAKVGVDVDIKMMNWTTFLGERSKSGYGMTMAGWVSGTLDPDGIVYPLLHSKFIRNIDLINWSHWRSAEGDKLMEEARSTYDRKTRDKLYQEVAVLADKDVPALYLAHPITAVAFRKNLKNVFIHESNWVPLLHAEFK